VENVDNGCLARRSVETTTVKDVYTSGDKLVDNSAACGFKKLFSQADGLLLRAYQQNGLTYPQNFAQMSVTKKLEKHPVKAGNSKRLR